MTQITHGFNGHPERCRYTYDAKLVGYAQVDTRQDASYFGIWANPTERVIFTYCEGDTTREECATDEEFVEAIHRMAAFYNDAGYGPVGIDPGWNHQNAIAKAFRRLGLGEMLH
jgi:hypothetical protein